MAEAESLNTMAQNSYTKLGDGSYAVKTTAQGGGSSQPVTIDPAGNTVKIDSANNTIKVDPANNVVKVDPNSASNVTSLTDTNSVAAPGANGVVCTVNLTVGTWDIEAITFISGTTVASLEVTNMRLRLNAVAVSRILNPVPSTAGGVGTGQLRLRVVVAAGTPALDIVAVAAATAGSVYSGSVVARRVL